MQHARYIDIAEILWASIHCASIFKQLDLIKLKIGGSRFKNLNHLIFKLCILNSIRSNTLSTMFIETNKQKVRVNFGKLHVRTWSFVGTEANHTFDC